MPDYGKLKIIVSLQKKLGFIKNRKWSIRQSPQRKPKNASSDDLMKRLELVTGLEPATAGCP